MNHQGTKNPDALEQAASRLESIARDLLRVSQATQDYRGKVAPIAQGLTQVVGGSATGKDKRIASLLSGFAQGIGRSASASYHASEVANRLAEQARAEATEIRRQEEADRRARQQSDRR